MPLLYLIVAVIAAGFFISRSQTTMGAIMNAVPTKKPGDIVPFEDIFKKYGAMYDLEWQLIAAHAFVESSFNPRAYNTEGSSGLMQILLPLSKNRGATHQLNSGNLPAWINIDTTKIFDPDYNVWLGASLIAANISEYGWDVAISRYNSDSGGNYRPFKNQGYVDAVIKKYDEYMAAGKQP